MTKVTHSGDIERQNGDDWGFGRSRAPDL